MKTFLLILSITLFTFKSLFAQSGWFPVYSQTNYFGQSNFFTDANTGYQVGSKLTNGIDSPTVLKTTDAGNTWFEQMTPLRDSMYLGFLNIFFVNSNTGFITAAYSINVLNGRILKTTNAGNSWFKLSLPIYRHFIDVYFVNSTTGFETAYQGVLKTIDAGVTWQFQNVGNFFLIGIHFTDVNTGYIAANEGRIIKTTDGGSNWTIMTNTNTSQHLWDVYFINSNTGVAVGGEEDNSDNVIIRTTNAGMNWTQIPYGNSTCLFWSVRFITPTIGWRIGFCSQIVKTTDAGLSWHNQFSPSANYYRDCFFTDTLTGYIAGEPLIGTSDPGYILKTANGGGGFVGINNSSNEAPEQFRLYQNYPNPFNPVTKIRFDVPSDIISDAGVNTAHVRLSIYDINGREVSVLIERQLRPGSYEVEWSSHTGDNALENSSGVYFYSLFANGQLIDTKRMILLI